MKVEKMWIARKPYDESRPVRVHYDAFADLWSVEQDEEEIILCSHLCLRDAVFSKPDDYESYLIEGFIATFKELRDMQRDVIDDNDCYDYICVEFDGNVWTNPDGIPMHRADYLDMCVWEENKILAINTLEVKQ